MSGQVKRVERLEAEQAKDRESDLELALVRARAGEVPLPSEAEVRAMARRKGLEGRIGRARLAAGVYVNSQAEQARAERERLATESQADAEAEALEEFLSRRRRGSQDEHGRKCKHERRSAQA